MLIRPSYPLTLAQYTAMVSGAHVLEQDESGVKVLELSDNNILKIFRLRGLITSSFFFSNARSFCRNATRLSKLGIPSVKVKQLYHFKKTNDTAVLYEPLPGFTIRQLLKEDEGLSGATCSKIGQLIAKLHQCGIHFKSLHLGNIVLTPAGELGLIDIADMRIYPWSLQLNTRLRSFRRLTRYHRDMAALGKDKWALVVEAYVQAAKMKAKDNENFYSKIY
jgi:serine/threonine protein kinase